MNQRYQTTWKGIQEYHYRYGILPTLSGIANIHGSKNRSMGFKIAKRFLKEGIFSRTPDGQLCLGENFYLDFINNK